MASTCIALAAALTLSACGGAKISEQAGSSGTQNCGQLNLAVNPWVGYEANAAVVSYVAEHNLGCKVNKKDLKEEVSWQGFSTGEVDAVLENWGHDDLKQKYINEQHAAVPAGSTGVKGTIGWFVPKWMVDEHPDITDWHNLNKYADLFKTSESGDKGQLLDGDPSFVTNDEALVKNLNLNYKVVYAGSENALDEAFGKASQQHTPLIGYFYTPQWLETQMQLVKINLPAYQPGCDADAQKIACDYPPYDLDKVMSKKFADRGGPVVNLIKNFHWTNADQNQVASWIAKDKLTDDQAAKRWVDAHQDQVKEWLGQH